MRCGQVYVAEPGYVLGLAGVPKHCIVTELDGVATPDLSSFSAVYAGLVRRFLKRENGASKNGMDISNGDSKTAQTVALKYFTKDDRHRIKTATLRTHFNWHTSPTFFHRNWRTGVWEKSDLLDAVAEEVDMDAEVVGEENEMGAATASVNKKRKKASEEPEVPAANDDLAEVLRSPRTDDAPATSLAESVTRAVENSLCVAKCDIASVALADGVYSRSFEGNGLVLHHDIGENIGIVVVDRNTVQVSSCDVLVSISTHHASPSRLPIRD